VIELYAVIDADGPPLPPALSAVTRDGLAFVCAPAREQKLSPERLWEHEAVIESLMADRDLVPVRYGSRVEDEGAAARALEERHRELARALDGVRGAIELSVRVLGDRADASPKVEEAASGAEYLRAKVRSAVAEARISHAVHEPLERLARAAMQRPCTSPGELLRGAYLVERAGVDDFVRQVSDLQAQHPELRLLCTGPWPPYSFSAS
jgi:hypothetical protein